MSVSEANSSIGYEGNIYITYPQKGTVVSRCVHNKGTKYLGDLITSALAGYSIDKKLPKKLGFMKVMGNNSIDLLNRQIFLSGVVWGDAVQYRATDDTIGQIQYTALLPAGCLSNISNSGTLNQNSLKLSLLTANDKEVATIEGQADKLKIIWEAVRGGQDVLIDWVMSITNTKQKGDGK